MLVKDEKCKRNVVIKSELLKQVIYVMGKIN